MCNLRYELENEQFKQLTRQSPCDNNFEHDEVDLRTSMFHRGRFHARDYQHVHVHELLDHVQTPFFAETYHN